MLLHLLIVFLLLNLESRRCDASLLHNNKRDSSSPPLVTTAKEEDKSFRQEQQHDVTTRNLIVGGQDSPPGRHLYMASMATNHGIHKCGGTLIAPDVVLTAAHCVGSFTQIQVGRYDIRDSRESFECFVPEEIVSHPRYYSHQRTDDDAYDFALVKLYGTSSMPVVKLNRDPNLPAQRGDLLTIVGWGIVDTVSRSVSNILQETFVNYIPNDECREIMGETGARPNKFVDLEAHIISVSLCAIDVDDRSDACSGDSGGPILLLGDTHEEDIHLGITSYGVAGCSHPLFPGIYARTQVAYSWIEEVVCRISNDVPPDFNCPDQTTTSNKESSSQTMMDPFTADDIVAVSIVIVLDYYPGENGWLIRSVNPETGRKVTYASRPIFSYSDRPERSTVVETIGLPKNRQYEFVMLDHANDGMCCSSFSGSGSVKIVEGEYNNNNTTPDLSSLASTTARSSSEPTVLLDRFFLRFKSSIVLDFVVGTIPTAAPSATPMPSTTIMPSMAPSPQREYLSLDILFDEIPSEVGWTLDWVVNETFSKRVAFRYPGDYASREPNSRVVESPIYLPPGATDFVFVMIDNERNGICCQYGQGKATLWYGEVFYGQVLFEFSQFLIEDRREFSLREKQQMMGNETDTNLPPPPTTMGNGGELPSSGVATTFWGWATATLLTVLCMYHT